MKGDWIAFLPVLRFALRGIRAAVSINRWTMVKNTFHKQKEVQLPQEILQKYLNKEEIRQFNQKEIGIFSITVAAEKAK